MLDPSRISDIARKHEPALGQRRPRLREGARDGTYSCAETFLCCDRPGGDPRRLSLLRSDGEDRLRTQERRRSSSGRILAGCPPPRACGAAMARHTPSLPGISFARENRAVAETLGIGFEGRRRRAVRRRAPAAPLWRDIRLRFLESRLPVKSRRSRNPRYRYRLRREAKAENLVCQ